MNFSEDTLKNWNPLISFGCSVHDFFSDILLKYLKQVKILLLVAAHASLLGILFPHLAKSFGSLAQILLFVILFVSPLSKLFHMKILYQIMSLRRELGIWFAYAALVHGLGYLLNPQWSAFFITPFLSHPLSIMPSYLVGVIALILTIPLLITSNNLSLRLLKGNWKKLHSLTYVVFAGMLFHTAFLRYNGTSLVMHLIQPLFIFSVYVFLKILAKNNFITPLREINDYVGKQYRMYQVAKRS
jgi:sulfoxide reductase heme-binding subunit YedZ